MTFDPKLAAGGTVIVILGGGSGYLISNSVSSNSEKDSSSEKPSLYTSEAFGDGTVGKALKDSKFKLLEPTKENDSEWITLASAHSTTAQNIDKESLKGSCKTLLEKTYTSSNTASDDFKNAVKKCTKIIKFSERANDLTVSIVAESASDWSTRKSRFKKEMLTNGSISGVNIADSGGTATDAEAKSFCSKSGELTWKTISTEAGKLSLETEWKNFLTVCAVEESNKTKDFWTGSEVASSGN